MLVLSRRKKWTKGNAMWKKIAVYTALFVVQWIIAGFAAVGVLALLCLWNGDLMFLVWDYPGLTISGISVLFNVALCFWGWGIQWTVRESIRKPLEDLEAIAKRMRMKSSDCKKTGFSDLTNR